MAIFNSYVTNYQRVLYMIIYDYVLYKIWYVMGIWWDKKDLIIWPIMMEYYIDIIMTARVF